MMFLGFAETVLLCGEGEHRPLARRRFLSDSKISSAWLGGTTLSFQPLQQDDRAFEERIQVEKCVSEERGSELPLLGYGPTSWSR